MRSRKERRQGSDVDRKGTYELLSLSMAAWWNILQGILHA